jgi:hypothetical protein
LLKVYALLIPYVFLISICMFLSYWKMWIISLTVTMNIELEYLNWSYNCCFAEVYAREEGRWY